MLEKDKFAGKLKKAMDGYIEEDWLNRFDGDEIG